MSFTGLRVQHVRRPRRRRPLGLSLALAPTLALALLLVTVVATYALSGRWREPGPSMGRSTSASAVAGTQPDSDADAVIWFEVSAPVLTGTVWRWPGADSESCRLDELSFEAYRGECFLPIDLDASGTVVARRWRQGRWEGVRLEVAAGPYDIQHIRLPDDTYVHLADEDAARAARERERIDALWQRAGGARYELPLLAPLEPLPAGGRFGSRRVVNGEPRSPHTGADFAADRGTPVLATARGEVVIAEEHFFAGNSVFIDHGGALISMYFHLDEIAVTEGQQVEAGTVLGMVGSTGRSTGPHLHFGLRWHGARVDPRPLLQPIDVLPVVEAR